MKNNERLQKFLGLVSEEVSGFEEKALWRIKNKDWLEKSALIAIKILRALKDQQLSQKELAEKMQVSAQYISKIVKGSENLSLDTISKLETALNIRLIEVAGINATSQYIQQQFISTVIVVKASGVAKVIPLNKPAEVKTKELPCEVSKTA